MTKRREVTPTDGELAILAVLWKTGPATVRQVNEVLNRERRTGYTTTLKLMQIMTRKGLLDRNDSERTHVYKAAFAAADTERHMVSELLEKVFGGSAKALVMSALTAKKVPPDELARVRKLLDEIEGEHKDER